MGINVTTSKQQIQASVAEDKVTATVSAGIGPQGPQGPVGPQGPSYTLPVAASGTLGGVQAGGTGITIDGSGVISVTSGAYATLVNGTVPANQLPSYVDDVLEYANVASLPNTGETGKIYVALNTGKIYRWSGSAYFEISMPPGNTDAVPEGSTNLYFTNARARNAFGTGATGQVITWSGGQWTAGSVTVAAGDISSGTLASARLPIASAGSLGAVRIGSGISIDGSGIISASSGYTLPTATASVLGGVKIGSGISIDGDGVISASAGYTLPTATNTVLGGVKIGSGVTITDGVISVSTNYAASSHTHAWSDITSGVPTTLSGYGITDAVASNDARLTDARTPTAHKTSHATGGSDALSPADIGAAASSHAHAWSDITSGVPSTFAPSAHKSTHAVGGSDALTPSDIGAAAVSHAHSATADLTFAGATAGQVLTVNSGATALVWSTPATYTLPQATGSTLGGITVSTGLSVASGALSVSYGTSSGTACQGNDARLSDARTPTDGSVTDAKITSGGLSASSVNWVGITAWAPSTAYAKGALVEYQGIAYRRSAAGTSGTTFNTSNWQQVTPSTFVEAQLPVTTTIHPFLLAGM